MYKCKFFKIEEIIDKKTYEKFGENAWQFFPEKALLMIDGFRDFIAKPCTINNWKSGGQYEFSGFRPRWCETGAEYSMHRLGQAFDVKVFGMTIPQVYELVMKNKDDSRLQYITAIEDIQYTPTWLHIDCRNVERIKIVKP